MIEKISIALDKDNFTLQGEKSCSELNPKALMLLSAAKCSGHTITSLFKRDKLEIVGFEVSVWGELSTETPKSESVYESFHVRYHIECVSLADQDRIAHDINLGHDTICGMMKMLRMIAPVIHEIDIVSTASAFV